MDKQFIVTLNRATRVILSLSLVITVILTVSLDVLVSLIFHFKEAESVLLSLTTKAYLLGLFGQCLLEVVTRAYYAKQDSRTPFLVTLIRMVIFIVLSIVFLNSMGVVGLALFDSITVTFEAGVLFYLLARRNRELLRTDGSIFRLVVASALCICLIYFVGLLLPGSHSMAVVIALTLSCVISGFIMRKDLTVLMKL